jgi:hypothetical protein
MDTGALQLQKYLCDPSLTLAFKMRTWGGRTGSSEKRRGTGEGGGGGGRAIPASWLRESQLRQDIIAQLRKEVGLGGWGHGGGENLLAKRSRATRPLESELMQEQARPEREGTEK